MPLSTNFNVSPYFDDFDETKKYYRILFKPATAVQARELTQLQTLIQNQIERFADTIFKPGSVLDGCAIHQIPFLAGVRLSDTYSNGALIVLDGFTDYTVTSINTGLKAKIVYPVRGNASSYPSTNIVYFHYLNTGANAAISASDIKTFSNADLLMISDSNGAFVGNVYTYSNTASGTTTTTEAYAITVGSGMIYKRGYFLTTDTQTVIVSSNSYVVDDLVGGFDVTETIVTSAADTDILDNAVGYSNFNAPGADRVKLEPYMVIVNNAVASNTAGFLPIISFENGNPVRINTNLQLSRLGDELATREYDTSGNFVVKPFNVVTRKNPNDPYMLDVVISAGKGYVKGYPVELSRAYTVHTPRGIDSLNYSTSLQIGYGNYVIVNELAGVFNFSGAESVNIYDTAQQALTGRKFSSLTPAGNIIGTANLRTVLNKSGQAGTPAAQYYVYLFNVKMNSGYSFTNNAKSIYFSSGGVTGIADLILKNNQATIYSGSGTNYLFGFGKNAVKSVTYAGNSHNTSQVVRTRAFSTLATTGLIPLTLSGRGGSTGTEVLNYGIGNLTDSSASRWMAIATESNRSAANLTGVVSVSGVTVTGTGTLFNSQLSPGEYVQFAKTTGSTLSVAGDIRRIVSISSNTVMTLDATANTYTANGMFKYIPAGYVFPFDSTMVGGATRSINVTSTTQATINTGFGIVGALNATSNVTIYYEMLRSNSIPANLTTQENVVVKIDTSTNTGKVTGPWSLGIPHVARLKHVYVGSNYSNSNVDYINQFYFDNGQRDTHYDLATLYPLPGAPVTSSSKIMVVLDSFKPDYTYGTSFFTVDSYPIDDAVDSNTTIVTAEIPVYTDSAQNHKNLRNYVDFRPVVQNTATITTSESSATINPANNTTLFQVDTNSISGLYVPAPDTRLTSNIEYYVGRQELIYIDASGKINIRRGEVSENPHQVTPPPDFLTVAYLNIKPFPSLTSEEQSVQINVNKQAVGIIRDTTYGNQITPVSIRRYTMSDIGVLEERISKLEYYTSLSLLEKAATDMQIPTADGLNRFKNGIFVETFTSHAYGDISNQEYRVAVHVWENHARAITTTDRIDLTKYSMSYANNIGSSFTLDYTPDTYFRQLYVSEITSVSDMPSFVSGQLNLYPRQIHQVDTVSIPQIQTTTSSTQVLNNAANNVNNLQYGTNFPRPATDALPPTNSGSSIGATLGTGTTGGMSTSGSQTQATGSMNQTTTSSVQTVVPYIRDTVIAFKSTTLRPNTVVWPYLNGTRWSNYTSPGLPNTAVTDTSDHNIVYSTGAPGAELKTNANGSIWGKFTIPSGSVLTGRNIMFGVTDAYGDYISEQGLLAAELGWSGQASTYAYSAFDADHILEYNYYTIDIPVGPAPLPIANNGPTSFTANTPPPAPTPPTYSFSSIPSSVDEGNTATLYVSTNNVVDGTTLYWTIASHSEDFGTTSGSFTIASNAGAFQVTPTADALTEGAETFTAAIRTVSTSGAVVATSNTITINDTSLSAPTYTFSSVPSSINEGSSGTFYVGTTYVPDGTTLYWTSNNVTTTSGDFSSTSGSFTVTSGAGSFQVTPTADALTEGAETFTVVLRTDSTTGAVQATSSAVTINDTSLTRTYAFGTIPTSINEGSAGTLNVTTANVPDGTTLYWKISAGYEGDFGTSSGSFTVTSNAGSFTVTPTADSTTEGAETFTVDLMTGSVSGTVVATSSSITINDTSTGPTYAASGPGSVNEGAAAAISVTTSGVTNGTTLYWTLSYTTASAADFGTTSGSFTINSNAGTFNVTPSADTTTEGAEAFKVNIRTGSVAGPIVAITGGITINDTSTSPPTYAFGTIPTSINEGSSGTFYAATTDVADGTTLYWTINNVTTASADFGSSSGSFTVTSGAGSFTVSAVADTTTEGAQTFTVQLRTGSTSGTVVATSSSVTINDTSLSAPTYAFGTIPTSINEGSSGTFNVVTGYVADGTVLYWTAASHSEDLNYASGSFTVINNGGSFIVTPTADNTTEGAETFTIAIRTGSTSGSIKVTSNQVTINDTSITPVVTVSPPLSNTSGTRPANSYGIPVGVSSSAATSSASAAAAAAAGAAGGGAGGGGAGACFTYNTLVEMADGTTKNISEVVIGDRVYNRNKTTINTVTFVEYSDGEFDLYTPLAKIKPFATTDHPIYIDDDLYSVNPDAVFEVYPWLGKTQQLKVAKLTKSKKITVYNLWVDGDQTYMVNGYGTTTIIGDGGLMKNAYDLNIITHDQVMSMMSYFFKEGNGKNLSYGAYLANKYIGKLNSNIITKIIISINLNGKQNIVGKPLTAINKFNHFIVDKLGSMAWLLKNKK